MRILFLGSTDSEICQFLQAEGNEVSVTSEKLLPSSFDYRKFDRVVSHGYRHLIKPEVLALFKEPAINCHISLLPWNRGANPNFWSVYENTPKGVTIHEIDAGLDTGPVVAQKKINEFSSEETLASTYQLLQKEISELFKESWRSIADSSYVPMRNPASRGTYHALKDIEPLKKILVKGWDTPVWLIAHQGRIRE